jgi:hypothetical protein
MIQGGHLMNIGCGGNGKGRKFNNEICESLKAKLLFLISKFVKSCFTSLHVVISISIHCQNNNY